jgi:DNA primase catalytic core
MPRLSADVLESIKSRVSLERLAEARGIVLTRHGADLHGRCPFHEDKTPSLVITPAKNLWHCLGACQAGGSVIDWVMKSEGVSFRHAVELLQNDYLPAAASAPPAKLSRTQKLPTTFAREAEDAKLLAQVVRYYHETLLQSPEALDYLTRRGIGSTDAMERFQLGYANRTLGYRLPDKTRVEGAAIRGQLQRLGLLRESGHEHFSGSLVIPVINAQGEVTEIYGRKLLDNLRAGTPKHLYLPGPHRGVWNEAALRAAALSVSPEMILCESLIDALTFWCAGFRNVTTSYGVEGFTADHFAAFKTNNLQRVLIAYDRDEAGDKAAEKLAAKLTAEGLDCYRILFPKGMDANEYALNVLPANKSLGVAIRSAQWLGTGTPKPRPAIEPAVVVSSSVAEPSLAAESEKPATKEAITSRVALAEMSPPTLLAEEPTTLPPRDVALPAAVIPPAPTALPELDASAPHEYAMTVGARRYRVRGLDNNANAECLKVNLLVSGPGLENTPAMHVDVLDLYQARQRSAFTAAAASELSLAPEIVKADLAQLLLALETEQEKRLAPPKAPLLPVAKLSDAERDAALALLQDPQLIERIAQDFSRSGIVGERDNALVGYLAAVSRKLDRPLALLIQSTSAAGKSSLLDAVLRFIPEEDRIVYSAMTGQSLFYMGEMNLKHKLLAIAEQEGVARASYALKLLQSEGELTIASTSKDPATGKLMTEEYRVEGPVMIALTTTAAEIDEELLNRCLVLTVDEGRAQTQAIHRQQRQRRMLAGLQGKAARETLWTLHQNAQRLLEPLAVVNPYADQLTFLDDRTRTRRDHEKYLTLIDALALLHQHQRPVREITRGEKTLRYVEVTLADIALANNLAHEVLGRTLDELPPQTRRLLGLIASMVEAECQALGIRRAQHRFSRRAVRDYSKWGDTQVKVHLARLVELEYLLVHRGGRGQSFEYELLFDGETEANTPHVSGLIDVERLQAHGTRTYDAERSGSNDTRSGSGRPAVGAESADSRGADRCETSEKSAALPLTCALNGKNARQGVSPSRTSYLPSSL